uniref:INO80 complex subunit E n=1 Tax=Myxine glutinosa TaxID=7769 RepID=UPI003590188A
MNGQQEVDYRKKYKNLKRKLRLVIYEQECFQDELRKAQRKLLKVSRDKSFLLDRLLQYENMDDTSTDSEATLSSDGDTEIQKLLDLPPAKKRRASSVGPMGSSSRSQIAPSTPSQARTPPHFLHSVWDE